MLAPLKLAKELINKCHEICIEAFKMVPIYWSDDIMPSIRFHNYNILNQISQTSKAISKRS